MTDGLKHNKVGGYQFLSAPNRPFSLGVVAETGLDIAHVSFDRPIPLVAGLEAAVRHVTAAGRPAQAIAGFELRIPVPLSRSDFDAFNRGYVSLLSGLGLVIDGAIPAGRTNVAPSVGAVDAPSVFGFSYTAPGSRTSPAFLLSGVPEEVGGDTSAMLTNIAQVLARRAAELGCRLSESTDIQIYGDSSLEPGTLGGVAEAFGPAMLRGLRWFPSLPPIEGLRFEIDARSSFEQIISPGDGADVRP